MNYEATYSEMEEVAKSLEQSSVSLKAKSGKSNGMVNAVNNNNKKPCEKCKKHDHQTSECKSPQCTYCRGYFHLQNKCLVNPQATGSFKGEEFARNFWAKTGRKPPTATVAATGGTAKASTAAPATTAASIGGIIAVAAIKDGALVQNKLLNQLLGMLLPYSQIPEQLSISVAVLVLRPGVCILKNWALEKLHSLMFKGVRSPCLVRQLLV